MVKQSPNSKSNKLIINQIAHKNVSKAHLADESEADVPEMPKAPKLRPQKIDINKSKISLW